MFLGNLASWIAQEAVCVEGQTQTKESVQLACWLAREQSHHVFWEFILLHHEPIVIAILTLDDATFCKYQWALRCQDDGIGMSEADLEKTCTSTFVHNCNPCFPTFQTYSDRNWLTVSIQDIVWNDWPIAHPRFMLPFTIIKQRTVRSCFETAHANIL